jgi:hypothetical protein
MKRLPKKRGPEPLIDSKTPTEPEIEEKIMTSKKSQVLCVLV